MKDKFQSKAVPRGTRTIWRYLSALILLFTFAIGNVWGATTLFTTNFSTTDGWSNENITTSGQPSNSKVIKGTTISFLGYKSASAKVSSATATGGTFTFTSNNLAASEGDITASNPNYYMAIPVSGIVCGMVTVTITSSSGYKPYYTYQDGASGKVAGRLQAAVNNTFTITGLTSTNAVIYLGNSGKTMTSLTITTPDLTDLSESAFYQLYATTSKTCAKLIEDAELPTYITTNTLTEVSSESGNSSSVSTPHDFTNLGTGAIYRLKTSNGSNIVLEGLSHVKSIRLYGNGNGSTRTVTVTATKISGVGTAPAISNISMPNSKKTVVEYSTGDLTEKSGYDINTYYTYTLSFNGACDIWGLYVEYAVPPCTKPQTPVVTVGDKTHNSATVVLDGGNSVGFPSGTVGYYVYVEKKSDHSVIKDWVECTSQEYALSGLEAETTYTVKAKAIGGSGKCATGDESEGVDFATEAPSCGVVTAPTSLLVGATTADGASFTIIDDADAFNYEFYVSESSTEPESSAIATHTSTDKTKDVTGLTSGTTYYAWVRSVCDADHKSTWTAANSSFKVRTTPTASFADANYIIGASAIDVSANFTSNSEASVVYELKESYPNVTLTGSSFSATVAGEYVVVANQAGNTDYTPISKEATVTVMDNELSDIFIFSKKADYGGDTKCISATQANSDDPTHLYMDITYEGFTKMGRAATANTECVLTFTVKDTYKSLFGIKSICTFGKFEEPAGGQISWDGGTNWEDLAKYTDSKKEFNAPAATYPTSFKIRFLGVKTDEGGLWWRNALVTLEVKKTVTSTVVELNNVKVDGTAIEASELSSLLTNKTLDIATVFTTAPTVTFVKRTTVNYAGGWPADMIDEEIDVVASDVTTNWSASQLINVNTYTVTLAKPTVPSLVTDATGFTLTSAKIATDTESFTFSGMNLTSGNVTIALESPVAGMTVSPAEVTPTAGVITDQEVTITYKSLEDVAEANVNLVVYYDADTKIVLPLTYSSTAGIEDLTSISAATTWNWDHANSSTEAIESLDANNIVVFANYSGWVESFKANSLAGKLQYVYRGNNYAQGHSLKFNTTVPGMVTVSFSNTSTKTVARAPRITDANGTYAPTDEADGAKTADKKSYSHAVAAGDVLIEGFEMQEGTPANMLRFYEVRFVPTFSVTYMPNGGTGAEYITDDAATEVRAGSIFTAPASSAFVAWNTQADGNGDAYLPGAAVTADLTLFAQWETSYMVTFDLQGHGDAIDPQNIVSGGKVVKPADPSADAWEFGGWYKESTCENEWDFATDVVTTTTTIFAKWTADPCPTPFSLSKLVLTSASDGTVTGYNNDEYAGEKVIGGLGESQTADVDPSHEGVETGYKLSSGGSAIVFATLKKGTFQVGDRVVVTITKAQDAYKVEEVAQPILDIYYGTDKNDATFLTTIENVTAAGTYTYRLTAADVTAIGTKKGIGVFRPSSGRTQNPYVYSVEIKGCREWAIFHTLTFKNIDGTAPIAAEPLEEGAAASTVAPIAPKIAMKRFLGWAEDIDGTPVELTSYTITEDKTLYAVYEDIVCPTSGTVYKFQLKTDLTNGNIFTSAPGELTLNTTDHLSSMVNGEVTVNLASGKNTNRVQFYDGKAIGFANGDGASITLTLDCALATGDEIRFINYAGNGNKMNLSDGTHSLELNGNNAETVQKITVNSDWNGADELTLTRGNNTPKLTYFEIYRRPELTGASMADFTLGVGQSRTPNLILEPSPDAIVNSEEWVITATTNLTGAAINSTTGEITTGTLDDESIDGSISVKVTLNGTIEATCTVTVVKAYPQANVEESMLWDWSASCWAGKANTKMTGEDIDHDLLMANTGVNIVNSDDFRSDMLIVNGEYAWRTEGSGKEYFQGNSIKFTTTVAGAARVYFRSTGSGKTVEVSINGTVAGSRTNTFGWSDYVVVPAGEVAIVGTGDGYTRIQKIEFLGAIDSRTGYAARELGTVCYEDDAVIFGANTYALSGTNEHGYAVFDEIPSGEIEAGNPYLFESNGGEVLICKKVNANHADDEIPVNGMIGSFLGTTLIPGNGNYYYFSGRNIWRVNDFTVNIPVPAHRCYVDYDVLSTSPAPLAPAPGRRRVVLGVNGENQAQGFENIENGDAPMKVMIDGTLYILRGEKVFDATGRLVK